MIYGHFVRGQINQNGMTELLIHKGNILKQVTSEDGVDDSYSYYVNLCRPLVPMPGTNCPAGAWSCRVKKQADQEEGKHEIQVNGHICQSCLEKTNTCTGLCIVSLVTLGCSSFFLKLLL